MSNLSRRILNGWSDIHVAAAAGDLGRVRLAVQKNPTDVDRPTKERQTALHLAAAGGFEAVVGELLDRHARTALQDEAGRTPLHAAAEAGHARCVAALLGPRNREPPAERSRLLGLRDRQGREALLAAVVAGQAGAVEELVRGGADAARCTDQSGSGLVLVAVRCGHTHLLPLLAAACGGLLLQQRDPATGGTPLHVAAAAGLLGPLQWLLAAGASTGTRDNAGRTPAEAALAAGQHAAARAIREAVMTPPLSSPPMPAAATSSATSSSAMSAAAVHALGSAGGGKHSLYGGRGAGQGGMQAAGVGGAAATSSTPWQQQQQQGAGGQEPAGPAAAGGAGGKLQIPETPPQAVYYPTPLPGAGVYF
ncbi:hypothetical protein Agub_g6335 [Astrephomene gubernaculifera]|uniref:Uncharacterized protein n=1 Tax=Astrephomene gubernaculifera TaxID=47775 RepID=A0AAD3DPU7_9CHLO|nr:hypothetical protein Agub_g6335 [Astrephomene gubernaculifera]